MVVKRSTRARRVAVVGAGPAGLCAARHSVAQGHTCTVFEQTDVVGGTWQYTDCVGTDRYGIPIHTSMYRNLRTNVPKEVVQFPGFPHKDFAESYITSEDILEYLNDFADKCDLRKHCKFNHHVKKITRTETEWEIIVIDLPNNEERTYTFDAVFICNGLNNRPFTPYIKGAEVFKGVTLHSHDYRRPEPFSGQQVLIVGGGTSAMDLTNHISKCANKVIFSHHSDRFKEEDLGLRDNVICKPDVEQLCDNSAQFKDGTVENIDAIMYCTGYQCYYKFLDESCGITEDEGLVYPLYNFFINANHSSMCILGNMCFSMQFPTFDIQVRFFLKALNDNSILPSKEEMLEGIKDRAQTKLIDGTPKKAYFMTTAEEDAEYYRQLAATADIEPVPSVLSKIHARAVSQIYANFPHFREDRYKIIDDENFVVNNLSS